VLNGQVNKFKILKPNWSFDVVFFDEAYNQTFFVLSNARRQFASYSVAECSILFSG
jgi:hypothetical protein